MIRYRQYVNGTCGATFYIFEDVGDEVPMHNHVRNKGVHNVVCLTGRVLIHGPGLSVTLAPGQIADLDIAQDHAVTALAPGTQTGHFFTHGIPEGFVHGVEGTL